MFLLPNADLAHIPIEKLTEYSLNPEHPIGKHKAAVFKAALDITESDAGYLKTKILEAVLVCEAMPTRSDEFGQRYQVEFDLERNGRTATIVTAWIMEHTQSSPRLTTCYVK